MDSTHIEERQPDDAEQHAAAEGHAHPEPAEYVKVAIALALVTALEIALFYIDALPDAVVFASLMVLMVIKFALVALWFMHLKFDNRIFMRFFVTGLVLAVTVFAVVLLTFGLLID